MDMPLRLLCLVALGLPLNRAVAQPTVSQDDQAALDRVLHLWAGALLEDGRSYNTTQTGDGIKVRVPVARKAASASAGSIVGPDLTLTAQRQPDGLWHLTDITQPNPLTIAGAANRAGSRVSMECELGKQHGEALIDPNLASHGWADFRFDTMRVRAKMPQLPITVTTGAAHTRTEWLPRDSGRVDIAHASELQDLDMQLGSATRVRIGVADMRLGQQIESLDLAGAAAVSGSGLGMIGMLAAPQIPARPPDPGMENKARLPPETRRSLRTMLDMVRLASGAFHQTMEMSGMTFDVDNGRVGLQQVGWVLDATAPADKIKVSLELIFGGLELPPALARQTGGLLPHRVSLTPRLSGLPRDATLRLLERVVEPDGTDAAGLEQAALELFQHGPIAAGIDNVAFDVGPARFSGGGEMVAEAPSLGQLHGHAHIEAKDLDGLIKRSGSNQSGLPPQFTAGLIFLKGLGDQHGVSTVWEVDYADQHWTVNGRRVDELIPPK